MDIVEAIRILTIPVEWEDGGLSLEQKGRIYKDRVRFNQSVPVVENPKMYYSLTLEAGRTVARAALDLFDSGANADAFLPHTILTNLANVVPGSLVGLYAELLARDLYWPEGAMFREADPATRNHLIALIDSGERNSTVGSSYTPDRLLCMLAWIGDEVVQEAFARWRQTPPAGLVKPEDSLYEAGWELTAEGKRRDLYFRQNTDLLLSEQELATKAPRPVHVLLPHEGRCGWCGNQLLTLFTLDLRDPHLAFLGMRGEQLRIAMCSNCTPQEQQITTNIDAFGGSRWSASNGDPRAEVNLNLWHGKNIVAQFLRQRFVLGLSRRTPFESLGSHLGGCPGWVQYAEYPRCPECQQTMIFVGQLEPHHIDYVEGVIYAFLCVPCGKATVGYQQ